MIKLFSKGVYLINNKEIIEDCNDINLILKNKYKRYLFSFSVVLKK